MMKCCLRGGLVLAASLLLACAAGSPVADSGGNGNGGGDPAPLLKPATFTASVNPTAPAGYSIAGETPYQWQAYVYYAGAWVAVGGRQSTAAPSATLVIDCNDPVLQDGCTLHRSAMIQLTVSSAVPGPVLLCAYKSGFQFRDDFLLSTPLGNLNLAPVASSSNDPRNEGTCFP